MKIVDFVAQLCSHHAMRRLAFRLCTAMSAARGTRGHTYLEWPIGTACILQRE
eukprot:COSAG06_NODE_52315_length_306_cov_1.004831_1_plen_52_part_01